MLAALKRLPTAALVAGGLLIVYLLAQFGRGLGSTLEITDHLDIDVPILSTLTLAQLFGPADAIVQAPLGGLPRWAVASPFNLVHVLHVAFGGFAASVIVETVTRFAALLFLPRLLRREAGVDSPIVAWGVGLCFAIMPINYSTIGTILLMPLVAVSFLELARGGSWRWIAGLAVYPLFSAIQIGFPALIMIAGLMLRMRWVEPQHLRRAGLVLVGLLAWFLVVDHQLILQIALGQGFVSHRVERVWQIQDLEYCLLSWMMTVILAQPEHHAQGYVFPLISLCFVAVMIMPMLSKVHKTRPPGGLFWALIGLFVLMALVYSFWFYGPVLALQERLRIADYYLRRFIYLAPLMLYAAWAIVLVRVLPWRWVQLVLIVGQIGILASQSQAAARFRDPEAMSYEQFFATRQFDRIRDAIGQPQDSYRIVSLGMSVNVPLYSGFQTLDGYLPNYPLDYKRRFQIVVMPELTRDVPPGDPRAIQLQRMRDRFLKWGNTLQIYTVELMYSYVKVVDKQGTIQNRIKRENKLITLKMDFAGFYPHGVRYLISATPIETAPNNHLKLLGIFDEDDSPYRLHLYSILPPEGAAP